MSGLLRSSHIRLGRGRLRQIGLSRRHRAAHTPLRVVLYHHITNQVSSLVDRLGVSTRPAVFEAHIRRMARDYEVVGLDAVLSGNLPRRALLITFDDGYRSFVDAALPVLRRLGLPSVLFLTAACLDPYSFRSTTSSRTSARASASSGLGAALDPTAPPATF